jgi:hypothetical protein
LGLLLHPFKTIARVSRDRDPIQTLAIFGLPFYFWAGGIMGILVGRLLIGAPFFSFGRLAILSFLFISFISGAIFSYLAYWGLIYLRKKNG